MFFQNFAGLRLSKTEPISIHLASLNTSHFRNDLFDVFVWID